MFVHYHLLSLVCWCFGTVGTPGHIPNPAVKHRNTDGTRIAGRVGRRQHRGFNIQNTQSVIVWVFCYVNVVLYS